MSDGNYHIMRMNGLSPSGIPVSESCACVHDDAYECARIRDRISFPEIDCDDIEHRACECSCHDEDEDREEHPL